MSFVPIKTVESQGALMMHRARQLLVEQRTRLGNAIRGHLAEMGIVAAQGQRAAWRRCWRWSATPKTPTCRR